MSDIMEVTASIDRAKWSEFVYEHPHGNIFQTPEMQDVYERTKNYETITLATVDDGGEILALMQAVVIREMGGFLGSFSARSVVQGGPLFVDGEKGVSALEILVGYYGGLVYKRALYTQIRNMWDTS
ncbi:MAG: GNAT family N-acetyltransferase, partial [Euryarchaeota archaeon]|nr:GNAT family N-acetyltransferase [Euryarchaeota archaeon]